MEGKLRFKELQLQVQLQLDKSASIKLNDSTDDLLFASNSTADIKNVSYQRLSWWNSAVDHSQSVEQLPISRPTLQPNLQAQKATSWEVGRTIGNAGLYTLLDEDPYNDDTTWSKRSSFEEHDFERHMGIGDRCLVCGKKFIPLLKDASHCIYCGLCVHDECWTKVVTRGTKITDGNESKSMDPLELCHGARPGDGQTDLRFTKSSWLFVKSRFDLEPQSPTLNDHLYKKLLKDYAEYLHSILKALNKCGVKGLTVTELITGFNRILIGTLKRLEEETKLPMLDWRVYYEQFKAVFYDYEYYAEAKLDITKIGAIELAEELTLEDSRLFLAIPEEEFHNSAFTKKDKYKQATHIMEFIQRFNTISLFVIGEVLERDSPKERSAVIGHFIDIASGCHTLRNYNGMKAILGGLFAAPVYRLKKSWALVVKERKHRLDDMARILSEDANSAVYRETLSCANLPCVPFLGIFLTDLTYIDVAFSNQPELCQKKTTDIIDTIKLYQSFPFTCTAIFGLHSSMQNLKAVETDEKVLFELSLIKEPKDTPVMTSPRPETPTSLKITDLMQISPSDLERMSSDKAADVRKECMDHITKLRNELRDYPNKQLELDQLKHLEELVKPSTSTQSPSPLRPGIYLPTNVRPVDWTPSLDDDRPRPPPHMRSHRRCHSNTNGIASNSFTARLFGEESALRRNSTDVGHSTDTDEAKRSLGSRLLGKPHALRSSSAESLSKNTSLLSSPPPTRPLRLAPTSSGPLFPSSVSLDNGSPSRSPSPSPNYPISTQSHGQLGNGKSPRAPASFIRNGKMLHRTNAVLAAGDKNKHGYRSVSLQSPIISHLTPPPGMHQLYDDDQDDKDHHKPIHLKNKDNDKSVVEIPIPKPRDPETLVLDHPPSSCSLPRPPVQPPVQPLMNDGELDIRTAGTCLNRGIGRREKIKLWHRLIIMEQRHQEMAALLVGSINGSALAAAQIEDFNAAFELFNI